MTMLGPAVTTRHDGLVLPRPAVLDIVVRPGGLVAPVHTHTREDETLILVDGRLTARLGEDEIEADSGSVIFAPRHLAHTFWNATDAPARAIMVITPGVLAGYFADLPDVLVDPEGAAALSRHAAKYGMTLDFDSLTDLADRRYVTL
jgi:uncharacterized cupin superfamily protein